MIAYHVDRNNSIKPNARLIDFIQIPSEWINIEILRSRYPEGISYWGKTILEIQEAYESKALDLSYRESSNSEYWWNSYLIDILYEYERLSSYKNKPSRFQSLFACDSIESAIKWKKLFGSPNAKIYQIEFPENACIKADSSFLTGKINYFSLPTIQTAAKKYWEGTTNSLNYSNPEYLIKLPVKIIGIVPE